MLEKFELLANLSEHHLQELEKIGQLRSYSPGEFLLQEGEETTELYFLISGQVELYKIEPKTQKNIKFKEISSGQSFGEMSFIDGSPRSCSVKAVSNLKAYVLSRQKLIDNSLYAQEILNILDTTVTYQVNEFLRYLSDQHIISLQEKLDELKKRNNLGYLLIIMILTMFMVSIINGILDDFFPNYNLHSWLFNWTYIVVAVLIPSLLISNKLKLSFRQIGVTRKNLNKSIWEGLIISFGGILLLFSIFWLIDITNPEQQLVAKSLTFSLSITSIIYFLFSYIQEFFRAMLQVSLQGFLLDEKGYQAILITSLLFGMGHMQYGTQAIVITVIASTIFGFIYRRTYNLMGVSIVHFLLGFVVFPLGIL